jgi:D-alanyl-D-alanine carboxypeptidase
MEGSIAENPEARAVLALIEKTWEEEFKDKKMPGLSVGIVHDQALIWEKSFGYANVERKARADSNTLYGIASVTKPFAATALMQLRDAGKLSLDDPIEKYLPEFKVKSRFEDTRPMTFRQVVSHYEGLPSEPPLDHWASLRFPTYEDILNGLGRMEAILPIQTEIHYSNTGIAMMALAMERISGQPFREYMKDHVLRPLGMSRSDFDPIPEDADNVAVGYTMGPESIPKPAPTYDVNKTYLAPGGLWSSVEDIAKFISLQFRTGPQGGAQVLGSTTLREMWLPVSLDAEWSDGYGIGWNVHKLGDRRAIGHGGQRDGFISGVTIIPSLKIGIVALTNSHSDVWTTRRYCLDVLAQVIERVESRGGSYIIESGERFTAYLGRYAMRHFPEMEVCFVDGKLRVLETGSPPSTWNQRANIDSASKAAR